MPCSEVLLEGLAEGFYYVTTTTGSAVMIKTATDTIVATFGVRATWGGGGFMYAQF